MLETAPRLDTTNSFEALEALDDASIDDVENSQSNEDGTKNYTNDPLDDTQDQQETTSPKAKRGRPKKGEERGKGKEKAKTPAKKSYTTRNRVSFSEAMNAATSASAAKFQVNNSKLANSDMMAFKSWADQSDGQTTTPSKHGNLHNFQ